MFGSLALMRLLPVEEPGGFLEIGTTHRVVTFGSTATGARLSLFRHLAGHPSWPAKVSSSNDR
jgi:hypothetical protein